VYRPGPRCRDAFPRYFLRRLVREERGFTLTELLVVLTLGIVVLGVPLTLAIKTFIFQNNATSRSAATSRVEIGVGALVHDLRQATAATISTSSGTVTATLTVPQRDATGGHAPASQSVTWICTPAASCTRRVGTGSTTTAIPNVVSAALSPVTASGAATTTNPAYVTVTVSAFVSSEQGPHTTTVAATPVTVTDGVALRNFSA
jgi:Tfp pilus assembly protein PilW